MKEVFSMASHKGGSCGCVSRRELLSFAAASTAWILTEDALGDAIDLGPLHTAAGKTGPILQGGIIPERFEEAKRRAAKIVAKLTLPKKMLARGGERFPAFFPSDDPKSFRD
jgi:hypothetical protein